MANDFSQDDTCVALWRFESGALTTDSKGTNTLTALNTPTADTSDYKEGSACVNLVRTSSQALSITDANLDTGFPFKYGDTNKKGTFCGWFKFSGADWETIWSKYYLSSITFQFIRSGTELFIHWGSVSTGAGIIVPDDVWCHAGLVLDGINKTVYLRVFREDTGEIYEFSDTSASAISLYNTAPFGVPGGGYFNGKLDESVVFNRLLTSPEIDQVRLGTFTSVDIPFELTPEGIYCPNTITAFTFSDDFESGNLSAWDGSNVTSVETGISGMEGTYCAYLSGTDFESYLSKDITGFRPHISASFKFLSPADDTDSGWIFGFKSGSTQLATLLYSYYDGGIVYCNVYRGVPFTSSLIGAEFSFSAASPVTIIIDYTPHPTDGIFKLWVNQELVINATGNTGSEQLITQAFFGDPGEGNAAHFYIDEVSITSGAPVIAYSYDGNIPIKLVPTGTYSRALSITTTITVLGGLEMGSDAAPVFITPDTYKPAILGELRIGGNPDVKFIKPRVFLASTSGGFSLGGKFVSIVETEATAASATFYWPSVGGFVFGGIPATEFVAPTPYLVSVSGGFKLGGTFISDVNFVAPLDIAVASPARPGGYLVLGSDSKPIFVTPHPPVYTVPDDPGLITGLVLGGGGGVAFIVPQIFVAMGGGEIALESEPIAGESEVHDTYVLNGNVFEPSVFTGFRFNSYGLYKNKAYGANASGVYLLEGVDDDGEEIHTGVRIGPINFGTDHPKRLRSIHIGEAGENTRANVIADEKNGEPAAQAIFSVNGDHRRIPVDIGIQGVDYIIELTDFKTLSHLEIIPMMLWRK